MSARGERIRNVGPKSAAWLRQVGVRSHEDLLRVGPVAAFLKVKRAGFRPSLNLLYSMAGALHDCHWAELPEDLRQRLLAELEAAEAANPIQSSWDRRMAASEGAAGEGSSAADEAPLDETAGGEPPDRGISRFE